MDQSALLISLAGSLCVFSIICVLWNSVLLRQNPVRQRLLASIAKLTADPENSSAYLSAADKRRAVVLAVLKVFGLTAEARAPGIRSARQQLFLLVGILLIAISSLFFIQPALMRSLKNPALAWVLALGIVWFLVRITAGLWMDWQMRRWIAQASRGIIDVLDLWVLCLGAGMSFQSALVRVANDTELTVPALREQLYLTHQEILAGCSREEALRHFSRRCGDATDLKALISNIIQSERLGSSLSQTLRVYAASLRFKRQQDVKELMQKLPVKLAFPLVFCILPALFVVIAGPSFLRMLSALSGR